MKISRILHAGYVFESDKTQVLFDPIFENPFSKNCYAYPEIKFNYDLIEKLRPAAVFISHFHDDHLSFESLVYLDKNTPIYIFCIHDEILALIQKLGFGRVYSLALDVPIQIGPFEIIPRRALDFEVDSLLQIRAEGLNVLNVIDSWIDSDTLQQLIEYAHWDMILWPFQTMREIEVLAPSRALPASCRLPEEWITQLKLLKPKWVVPSSCQFIQEEWSWYNHAFFPISYRQFKNEVEEALPGSSVVRMDPSVSVYLSPENLITAPSLLWIQAIGAQNVDYEYRPEMIPPSTAEISKNFSPLNKEQKELVENFCRQGILAKLKTLDPPNDPYFWKTRYWRLVVYDHFGLGKKYIYKISGSNVSLAPETEDSLSWSTEISEAKLYGALAQGETLTSLYLRINDLVFSPEIESEIKEVDITEDPLIRSLFSNSFAAYQIAQLKRINK